MARTMLSDRQWHKLKPILKQINCYDKPNLRKVLEGILYRLRTGCPWRDIPTVFGKWYVIYQLYRYWQLTKKWQSLFDAVKHDDDCEWLFIDGSVVKAHQHSTGACSDSDEAIGKPVAGNSSKLHLVVDACGNPVYVEITAGQVHDSKQANSIIAHSVQDNTEAVVADKGYDSKAIRETISALNATAVIPVKSNSKLTNDNLDKCLYKYRHLVENAFANLKQFRGIATRYDKLKCRYEASVLIACSYLWLKVI